MPLLSGIVFHLILVGQLCQYSD